MYLLLIVLWCAAVMRGRRGHFPYSRFGVFNSRLGPNKFPFRPAREFARKGLNWLPFFVTKPLLDGANQKIPVSTGIAGKSCSHRMARIVVRMPFTGGHRSAERVSGLERQGSEQSS
jgi:hypothetical protein